MKEHYQKMFAYNAWANRQFIDCLAQPGVANAKNFLLMSHILAAEEVWHCRLKGVTAPLDVLWKEFTLEELEQKATDREEAWGSFLKDSGSAGLAASINYRNTKGQSFSTAVGDVLTHVINHGTYHRAQIATLLRLESIEPPVTDYIFYNRQQQEKEKGKQDASMNP